jgi:hypothetical protein
MRDEGVLDDLFRVCSGYDVGGKRVHVSRVPVVEHVERLQVSARDPCDERGIVGVGLGTVGHRRG